MVTVKSLQLIKKFMSESDVEKCFKDIKIKNNEGFDRIPQPILVKGCASLLPPKFTSKRNFLNNGLHQKSHQFAKK
jgi:hypothetical protein